MSPSKKLSSIGAGASNMGTDKKDTNNVNMNQNNQNSGQVERISVTIPSNPLLMPNASV